MANRRFYQFTFSLNPALTYLEGSFVVGSAGAVGTTKGSGFQSVEHLATGVYRINLADEYNRYLHGNAAFVAPVTGSPVSAGSLVTGTLYVIASLGTSDFTKVGIPVGLTPNVGMSFVATGTTTGTGSAIAVATSGISAVEVVGDPNVSIDQPVKGTSFPYIIMQCFNFSGALADPAAGSVCGFDMMLRNSSVKGKGE